MIHYTLLPESEIRHLRKEYRVRLFVVFFFFISLSVFIGIMSLLPTYILSKTEQDRVLKEVQEMKKERESRGINQIDKDFKSTQVVLDRVKMIPVSTPFSESIERIGSYRGSNVFINSFDLKKDVGTTTPQATHVVIQGRALSREALVTFKKKLETDESFRNIDLPISDLAKNKNISFSLKLDIIK